MKILNSFLAQSGFPLYFVQYASCMLDEYLNYINSLESLNSCHFLYLLMIFLLHNQEIVFCFFFLKF